MLGVLSKSYDAFIHVLLCQDELFNFEKLYSKLLLEEVKKEDEKIWNKVFLIERARGHFGTYYKGLRTYHDIQRSKKIRSIQLNVNSNIPPKFCKPMQRNHSNNYRI